MLPPDIEPERTGRVLFWYNKSKLNERYKMKTIIICILAAATLGLSISTVSLAIHAGNQAADNEALNGQVIDAKLETQRIKDQNDKIGMASCLIHGDATPAYASKCRATVDFFNAKPIEELEDYVKKVGYGL